MFPLDRIVQLLLDAFLNNNRLDSAWKHDKHVAALSLTFLQIV